MKNSQPTKNTLVPVKRNNLITNLLIATAVIAAAITGYMLLTGNSAKATNTNSGGGNNTNTGNNPISDNTTPQINCDASNDEFPLTKGAGYPGRANETCEKQYIIVIQTALNKDIANRWNMGIKDIAQLTVDGMFGSKTEQALIKLYGSGPVYQQFYNNMLTKN